ncbi:MAG TPA: hydroxymethylbilane synthase [Candidatus Baltobacteraceae bacterium]|nr:hydroxymethylbilane synthase [Candidatus Baltobacteraceae bacterium]
MLPIALRPDGRRAVVVGGGSVALRKAESLDAAGFEIFVVAPAIDARLRALVEHHGGSFAQRPYHCDDLDGAALVVAATSDDAVNAGVVADARARRVLACDAGDGEHGDFTMPAVLRLGDLTVSIESSGSSPSLAKRMLAEAATLFGPQYGDAARTLARMRAYVKAVVPSDRRAAVMRALADLPIGELATLNPVQAEHEVEAAIERLAGSESTGAPAGGTRSVTCASRASALAMTQTRAVAARLAERGIATTILPVTTTGDRVQDRPIERLGSAVFVKELELALRDGRADYAVHSCKDLPGEVPADMRIAAICTREDPRDAFCSERYSSFDALPAGAIVGTSSPRRRAALAALRGDLDYRDMRGNVDTRLRKLREGQYDAIVLAMAGLIRLRLRAAHTVPFDVETIVPAVAQGALAIETRAGESLAHELRAAVNDVPSELCVACERAALRTLRAGCTAPIGIHARFTGGATMLVDGFFSSGAGELRRARLERDVTGAEQAEALGAELAARLACPLAGRLVVLPRSQGRPSRIAEQLRALGARVVEVTAGDAGPDPAEAIPDMLLFASSGAVAAAAPYLDRLRELQRKPLVAAMGPQSARAAEQAGFTPDAVAAHASIDSLVRLACERLKEPT